MINFTWISSLSFKNFAPFHYLQSHISLQPPTCYKVYPPHIHQTNILALSKSIQSHAPGEARVSQHVMSTPSRNNQEWRRVLLSLLSPRRRRTPPHSLTQNFHVQLVWEGFALRNSTLSADQLFSHSTHENKGKHAYTSFKIFHAYLQ